MILSFAFSNCSMSTVRRFARAANRAASLMRLARSAPRETPVFPRAITFRLDVAVERNLAHVDLEDLLPTPNVGQRHDDLAIEASRTKQSRIENVGTVGRGDDDDPFVALETVHLDEQLIEGLLALVMPSPEARTSVTPNRVNLVDEDDAWCMLLGLLEHVAHPRCADTDEHLDEVRAGDREERNFRLARDGARKQRLTGSGGPYHQHSARDLAAELLKLRRIT